MDLYLIRHAEAEDLPPSSSMKDFDRPLTVEGHRFSIRLAEKLKSQGVRLDLLFHSPLVRAVQTAEPLIAAWGLGTDQVVVCEELAPGESNRKLAERISRQLASSIALVGHRPDINDFAGWLIGSKKAQVRFEKGTVARIRLEDETIEKGAGELVWLIPPAWIEAPTSQSSPQVIE